MLKGKLHAKITQFQVQSGSSGPARASAVALTSTSSLFKNPKDERWELGQGLRMDPEVTFLLTHEFPLFFSLDFPLPINTYWDVLNPNPVVALGQSHRSQLSLGESGLTAQD